jgi:uncharacterized protein YjbI with pentapeptide repeats
VKKKPIKRKSAKSTQGATAILRRLAGKNLYFAGSFAFGEENRLRKMAEAQLGVVVGSLSESVDIFVLPDLSAKKPLQRKAAALNAKGASIQILDGDGLWRLAIPTDAEAIALIRGGKENAEVFCKALGTTPGQFDYFQAANAMIFSFTGERFDGVDLTGFNFDRVAFHQCSFVGATLSKMGVILAKDCDFSQAKAQSAMFGDVEGSRFCKAELEKASFHGGISGADFSWANLDDALFVDNRYLQRNKPPNFAHGGCMFAGASLRMTRFDEMALAAPDFSASNLTEGTFHHCRLNAPNFRYAVLERAIFFESAAPDAILDGANCYQAGMAHLDLTNASVYGANLAESNLRGATLQGVDLSKANNIELKSTAGGTAGPALTELNLLAQQARRIGITFHASTDQNTEGEKVGIDTTGLKYGGALRLPPAIWQGRGSRFVNQTFADAMLSLADLLLNYKVRYETVEVSSTKSPKGGKELRELAIAAISEAFAQPLPAAEKLAAATKAYRDKNREAGAEGRTQIAEYKRRQKELKARAVKKLAKKIEKTVGKVTDIATFLTALELRVEKPKIDKATKMLKADRFKLFNDISETHLSGVVKSQTDADLVYACRIESGGGYACCTQNLNVCGGLRGSICKHLLVLIIGLVKAGELDPTTIDGWVAKTHGAKSELNKETMSEIFLRYKGAEAGEVDWRPTETVPEDYYAL